MITPTKAIESLDDLEKQINATRAHLSDEISEITEVWTGLGNAGGQRDDHAATLMQRLQPALQELAEFSGECAAQISEMTANPFGRK